MSDNNRNFDVSSTVYFIFCILFAVTGIWFPAAFMWVVWAFVGYVALMVIVAVIALIVAAVMVHKASKWF
jgi:hypothetical protein|nr:MAG TPA: hypothetical protein [Caudoviricetes sp.]